MYLFTVMLSYPSLCAYIGGVATYQFTAVWPKYLI